MEKILIVEDDKYDLQNIIKVLNFLEFKGEIDTANKVNVAIELIRNTQYDLVLLDHELDEGQICRHGTDILKMNIINCPVIGISSSYEGNKELKQNGATETISKDFIALYLPEEISKSAVKKLGTYITIKYIPF